MKSFAAVWFDAGNAYGSDAHKLTESAIDLCHILEKVQEIVKSCFRGIQICSNVDEFTPNSEKKVH